MYTHVHVSMYSLTVTVLPPEIKMSSPCKTNTVRLETGLIGYK